MGFISSLIDLPCCFFDFGSCRSSNQRLISKIKKIVQVFLLIGVLTSVSCQDQKPNNIESLPHSSQYTSVASVTMDCFIRSTDSTRPKSIKLDSNSILLAEKLRIFERNVSSRFAENENKAKKPASSPKTQNKTPEKSHYGNGYNHHDYGFESSVVNKGVTNFNTVLTTIGTPFSSSCLDGNGNIWFGTNFGYALKYNGRTFERHDISPGFKNSGINSIIKDNSGSLWFATSMGGVFKYDGSAIVKYDESSGLSSNNTKCIFQDKSGRIWVGTGNGVCFIEGDKVKRFNDSTLNFKLGVNCIIGDESGNIWFGTQYYGAIRFNGKSFMVYDKSKGLANNCVNDILEDTEGRVWFATLNGISRFDGEEIDNFLQGHENSLDHQAYDLMQCKNGEIWFGFEKKVVRLANGKFMEYSRNEGFNGNMVRSIIEDSSSSIWFCTKSGHINRFDASSITAYNSLVGLSAERVNGIIQKSNGVVWFGSDKGLHSFNGNSFLDYDTSMGLSSNYVLSVFNDDSENLWVGNIFGVDFYNGVDFVPSNELGLKILNVKSIYQDRSGTMWFGTYFQGIYRYDGTSLLNYNATNGLPGNWINTIHEDGNGFIWIGTSSGMCVFDGKRFMSFKLRSIPDEIEVSCIARDSSGGLWLGTQAGLLHINRQVIDSIAIRLNDKQASVFNYFNCNINIDSRFENISQICFLDNKKMLLGAESGIVLLEENDGSWKIWHDLSINTGYPINGISSSFGTICKLSNGRQFLYATTLSDKPLVLFDYGRLFYTKDKPGVFLQSIKLDGRNIDWLASYSNKTGDLTRIKNEIKPPKTDGNTGPYQEFSNDYSGIRFDSVGGFNPIPMGLELPFRFKRISFEFDCSEKAKNNLVQYKYILIGYDNEWSQATQTAEISYTDLKEGEYKLCFMARAPNGEWGSPASYAFVILAPWYRTWWAYALFSTSFILAIMTIIKVREKRFINEKIRLEKIIQLRTNDIVAEKNEVLNQKKRSDELLLNILPSEVAEELKNKGSAEARKYDVVTVMFTDFKGFSIISEKLSPSELVAEIHGCFKEFDRIIVKYGIEKIKTIGDSYMCAGGLPVANRTNAVDVVNAALEIQKFMENHMLNRKSLGHEFFEIRIGIHTGPVVAGIVGVKKFAYDIWGDTVNIASRMESSGEAGRVNISAATFEYVKNNFNCTYRGKVHAKNKGDIDMYFVDSRI